MQVIIANPQARVKDTYAASPSVGLVVRANGEEKVQVLDGKGGLFLAGMTPPSVAPGVASAGDGILTPNRYVGYAYAYAAQDVFPYVFSDVAIGGSLAPRSNSSPVSVVPTGTLGNQYDVVVTKTTAPGVSKIWIFRTEYFGTSIEAQTAGEAGQVYLIGSVTNNGVAGTVTFRDNVLNPDLSSQIELDNFEAPQFQFVVYYEPYWYGFGNFPFTAHATWTLGGLVTIAGADKWFNGRDGQLITFEGITTGGFDGRGTFRFKWASATTAHVTLDGITNVALPVAGSGQITIQGPATTLYRSKANNPFAWGRTITIGSSNVPSLYTLKVGGGLGTALAVIPNQAILKLDCEFPASWHTLNLKAAGTANFEQTLNSHLDDYSVSSHWSQFPAATQDGSKVLWGIDFKNFAILQSNGVAQVPISGAIPKILRRLTRTKHKQLMTHGAYDPRTELNCLWVATYDALTTINYCIFNHAPTGFWGFVEDFDVLCSAQIEDTETGTNKLFVGTERGFVGQALADGIFANWLPPTGLFAGSIADAGSNYILKDDDQNFNTADDGLIGNWCLVTDPNGEREQWARIGAVTATTLTFDLIRPLVPGYTDAFNPLPQTGWKFYIGMIECTLRKDFDLQQPHTRKSMQQFWATQQNDGNGTLVRFYREREEKHLQQFAILQNEYREGTPLEYTSDTFVKRLGVANQKVFCYGIEVVNRAYTDWRFISFLTQTESERA